MIIQVSSYSPLTLFRLTIVQLINAFPCDDEDVLEADEGDEVGHDAHLGVHVEAESREAERHEDGAEDGEDGAEGDAELGPDQLDLGAREVHIAELQRD